MLWMLWLGAAIVGVIILFGLVAYVVGGTIPEDHRASATLRLSNVAPDALWAIVSDVNTHTQWAGVTRLTRLPDQDGHELWRQEMGRNSFTLATTESSPATRLVRTIADDNKMFSGNWTYELRSDGATGTALTLTENGHVPGRVPRFFMKHLMGYHLYLKKHLRGLAKHVGQPDATIETRLH